MAARLSDVVGQARGIEFAARHSSTKRAIWLSVVPAIAKPALQCQGFDIIEFTLGDFRGVHGFQTPEARRVNNGSALRPDEQVTTGCGVSPATIMVAHVLRLLRVATEQLVGQCRFSDAGRANERDGAIAREILFQNLNAFPDARAYHMNGQVLIETHDLAAQSNNIVLQIRLVHQHDGSSTALLYQGTIAFHARQIEVATHGRHDKDDIDIRSQKLWIGLARCFANECTRPRQYCRNRRWAVSLGKFCGYEVANARQV